MDSSKGKGINIHMQERRIMHLRACSEGLFFTNLGDPSMVNNPINTSINLYYFIHLEIKT